jgi:hypothetical protein
MSQLHGIQIDQGRRRHLAANDGKESRNPLSLVGGGVADSERPSVHLTTARGTGAP